MKANAFKIESRCREVFNQCSDLLFESELQEDIYHAMKDNKTHIKMLKDFQIKPMILNSPNRDHETQHALYQARIKQEDKHVSLAD